MKLNNRGWGLGVFLSFVMLFVLCIIVATVNAYKMGLEKNGVPYFDGDVVTTPTPTPSSNSKYSVLEERILNASVNYKRDRYNQMSSGQTLYVKLTTLISENYLSDSDDCSGYVQIKNQSNEIKYKIFLKCSDYVTDGYDEKYVID